jgi:hypothetical protein
MEKIERKKVRERNPRRKASELTQNRIGRNGTDKKGLGNDLSKGRKRRKHEIGKNVKRRLTPNEAANG